MTRRRCAPVAVLLVVLLLLSLCLLSPTVADTASSKKKSSASFSSTAPPGKSASASHAASSLPSSSSAASAAPVASQSTAAAVDADSGRGGSGSGGSSSGSESARQERLERKRRRQEAGQRRSEQQTKRAADKAKKAGKKYVEQRKKRQDRDAKRQSRVQKFKERVEAYWTARKAATLPANLDKAAARVSRLSALTAATPLVQLKERQFDEFVVSSPRPYWVLVSLTALDKKYECKICELMHGAFHAAAPLIGAYSVALLNSSSSQLSTGDYNSLLSFNGSVTAAQREQLQRDHDDRAKRQLPVYVVELDIENARNVFNVLQLTTAPVVFVQPPSFAPKAPPMSNLLGGLNSRYKFVPQSLDITARTVLDFLNGHLDGKLTVAPTGGSAGWDGIAGVLSSVRDRITGFQPVILIYFSIILASLLLYFLVSLVGFYWRRSSPPFSTSTDPSSAAGNAPHSAGPAVDDASSSSLLAFFLPSTSVNVYSLSASSIASLNFYQLPRLLRTLPLIVAGITFYLFCVSGGMFTIIKDTDSGYSVSSTGKWEFRQWISNQYMDQTVIESTVLATLYLTLAALFVLLNSRTFYQPASQSASAFSASSIAGWLSSWLVSPLWIVLAAAFVYLQLVNVYSKKNSYNWGVNWRWLRQVDWQRAIPSPAFHRYLRLAWAEVLKRLI